MLCSRSSFVRSAPAACWLHDHLPLHPQLPGKRKQRARANRTEFPSFEQRATFGINPLQDTWDLSFTARTATERNNIYAFLEARRGTEPFQWTTPFDETGSFACTSWSTDLDSCALNTLTAKFELQYVPGGPNLVLPAAPTTAFSVAPDFVATKSYESQSRATNFGDGYKQRTLFGLRPQRKNGACLSTTAQTPSATRSATTYAAPRL